MYSSKEQVVNAICKIDIIQSAPTIWKHTTKEITHYLGQNW